MKNTYTWLIISFIICFLFPVKIQSQIKQNTYPGGVETVLKKSGKNRAELEKFLIYCRHSKDRLKWDAACFLIRNMDIHYSEVYHWVDEKNNKIGYNELSYPNFSQAIKAFENLSSEVKMKPVISKVYDMHVIKADYLIRNLELAFSAWKTSAPMRNASRNDEAPLGIIINSCKSTGASECAPPFMMFIIGTGYSLALAPPI